MKSSRLLCATALAMVGTNMACNSEAPATNGLDFAVDTLGDTLIVVRSMGGSLQGEGQLQPDVFIGVLEGAEEEMLGSVNALALGADGSIFFLDRQVPVVRQFDANGRFLRNFGREGSGPGEYKQPDGGMALLPDGRLVVRDPGNARFAVFGLDGSSQGHWPFQGGFSTSRSLYVETGGDIATQILLDMTVDVTEWVHGLARFDSTGVPKDTIPAPVWDYDRPIVSGRSENSSSSSGVPFSPDASWTYSPLGYFVGSLTTRYRVELFRKSERAIWIEKDWTPVRVNPDEASEAEMRIIENMQRNFGSWRWNGPPIPDTKPPIRGLSVGGEGNIWVQISQAGVPTMTREEADAEKERSGSTPQRFQEPVVYDVFLSDGRFKGRVTTPEGFTTFPAPIMRGDTVLGVLRDDLGVIRIVRGVVQWQPRESID